MSVRLKGLLSVCLAIFVSSGDVAVVLLACSIFITIFLIITLRDELKRKRK